MEFKFFICILTVVVALSDAKCERENSVQVKEYKINLDDAPIDRFTEVTRDFKEEILVLFNSERKKYGETLMQIADFLFKDLEKHIEYPFNEEIRGIAETLNTNIGDVVLFQILYDLTANKERHKKWCTGILTQDQNGQIFHGRNLDYDFPEMLQNLVYKAHFYRNGTLLYTSAQFAGHIGILTAHKHNSFTFSLNERNQGSWILNLLYGLLDKKAAPVSFLTRNLMENVTNYAEAVHLMETTDLIAPIYFIIGGVKPEESIVITRNQSDVVDTWKLNPNSSGFDRWFLIETNYDHWTQPPANDDRRTPAIMAMNKTTQANINYDTLFDVLTMKPVCNNMTAYSVVMSAKDDEKLGFKIIVH